MNKQLLFLFLLLAVAACSTGDKGSSSTEQSERSSEAGVSILPDWAITANIYEVNTRQYTPEGTFNAFKTHLPRLKEMGVDILWFMPITPISEEKRKGGLGSPYAVDDYKKINPDLGTEEDFRMLVQEAHKLGMYVILDWVANHTGWGNPWMAQNPEWYTHLGDTITHPLNEDGTLTDWYDVADLNYENTEMRAAMIDAMDYWVKEFDIDGYRCDVVWGIEDSFWKEAWTTLRRNKPLFSLAEAESPGDRDTAGFNASYGWSLHHILNEIAKGHKDVNAIDEWLENDRKTFPAKGFHMNFTSNHDENSWQGSEFERMGDGHQAFAVFASTFDGMPLVYSGQEEPIEKRLAFFEKDDIGFEKYAYADFYRTLLHLKKEEKALWNGTYGAEPVRINQSDKVYAYKREKEDSHVIVILNLSDTATETTLSTPIEDFTNIFTGEKETIPAGTAVALNAWEYKVLKK